MNKNNLIIMMLAISMMFMFTLSVISAEDLNPTIQKLPQEIKVGDSVDLPQGGSNGTAAWSFCNITRIIAPNHSVILNNLVMTKNGFSFSYTLSGGYTRDIGSYTVETICGDGVNLKPGIYSFEVTTTGSSMSISLWISLLLILIALVLFIVALYADNQYLGFISSLLFIVCGIYILIYGFGAMSDLYTNAIAMVVFGFGLIIFFISAFHQFGDGQGLAEYFGIKKDEYDEYDHFTRPEDE